MKRFYSLMLLSVSFLWSANVFGQSASSYSFTASSGTFTAINGTDTVSDIHADSKMSSPLSIGFSFNYEGVSYTKVNASSNGFLTFDTTSTNSRTGNDLDNVNEPILAPLWDDNDGRATGGSYASYVTTGTAPNRVFTFEWLNWEWRYNSSTPTASFQVKLYETSNKIEFVYRPESGTVSSGTASVGIVGSGTGSGTFLSADALTTSATVSSTSETTNISAKPSNGLTFTFAPPTCIAPAGLAVSNIGTTSVDLDWNTAGHVGDTILIEYGLDGYTTPIGTIVDTAMATGPQATLTGLSASTVYTAKVKYVCSPGDTSTVSEVTFSTLLIAPFLQDFESMPKGFPSLGWKNSNSVEPFWEVEESPEPNSGTTGPKHDHTQFGIDGGMYVFLETSSPASTGEQDTLTSPVISTATLSNPYLKFYYHMYGSTMGKLYVEVADSAGVWSRVDSLVGQDQTSETDPWKAFGVDLSSYTGNAKMQFRFIGERGSNYYSDMALDDISFGEKPVNEAGVESLVSTTFCSGSNDLTAVVKNFGLDTLKSVTVNWTVAVNGGSPVAQTPVNFTGTLLTSDTTHVNLGSYTFNSGSSYDIVAYTTVPNGQSDDNVLNDTLSLDSIETSLNGTYTLGGTSPDFTNFAALEAALNNNGVCGPTRVLVRQGVYNEQLVLSEIAGLSSANTLEIVTDPANTAPATLSFASTSSTENYVISFNGVSNVTIDSLELVATGSTYGRVIQFEGLNSDITITNNTITGVSTTSSTSTNLAVIYDYSGAANKNENISFEDNVIENGSYGVYLYGVGSSDFEEGLSFKNNEVTGYRYYGVYSYYQANAVFSGNYIKDNDNYTSPYGMRLYYNDTIEVYDNEIYVGGTSSPYGIYLYYCDGSSANPVKVYNNMIGMYNSSASGTVYGLYANQGYHNHIYHNNIDVQGGSTTARAMYFSYSTGDDAKIMNNNFVNMGGGYAVYASTNSGLDTSDYNNLYSSGTNVGYWSGARTDIAAYRTTSGMETNSVSVDPVYYSTTDLRTKGKGIDGKALSLAGYGTDIDGTTRNATTPDIGAFEFTPPANDVGVTAFIGASSGVCGDDSTAITVEVFNFGTAAQTNFDVQVDVTGSAVATFNATVASLPSGAYDTIVVGYANTLAGGTFNLTGFTKLATEQSLENDTLTISGFTVNAVPSSPTAPNVTICEGVDTTIVATGGSIGYRWYDAAIGGSLLSSTDTLSITNITSTDTMYVETFSTASASVGPVSNTAVGSGGTYTSFSDGLVFDANSSFVLDSVTVYVTGSGRVKLNLEDASGNLLDTASANVTGTGTHQIYVGMTVPAGSDLELNATGTTVTNLYRNSGGATFPYNSAGNEVSITGPINALSGYYYFFYNWKITVEGCPSDRAASVVTVNPTPTSAADADTAICSGDQITIDVNTNANNTVVWNGAVTAAQLTVDTANTYTAEITSPAGCMAYDTVVVSVNALPVVNLGADTAFCGTNGVQLDAGANGDYAWSTGDTTQTIQANTSGAYSVTFTDANQCVGKDTIGVTQNALPTLTVNNDTSICIGEQATLTAQTNASNVLWNGTVNSASITVDTTGMYIAVVTDANNCSAQDTVIVNVNSLPMVDLGADTSFCSYDSVTVDAGAGARLYTWSNNTNQQTLTINQSGTYWVQYKDMNDCVNSDTIEVVALTPVSPGLTAPSDVCADASSFNLSGGTPAGGTYAVNGTMATSFDPVAQGAGTYTLTYVLADTNGCLGENSVMFDVNALPSVTLTSFDTLCENESAISLTGGMPAGGTYAVDGSAAATFDPSQGPATYSVVYSYSDNNNCSNTATESILVNAAPVVDLGQDIEICGADEAALDAGAGASYSWSTGDSTQTISVQATGTYVVTVANAEGCSGMDTIEVSYEANCVGISEVLATKVDVTYFPNPTSGVVQLTAAGFEGSLELVVTDMNGRVLFNDNVDNDGVASKTVDMTTFENGVYFFHLKNTEGVVTHKVTVAK